LATEKEKSIEGGVRGEQGFQAGESINFGGGKFRACGVWIEKLLLKNVGRGGNSIGGARGGGQGLHSLSTLNKKGIREGWGTVLQKNINNWT